MTLDETGIGMTLADMEHFLMVQEMADNRICLLLFLDQELVALLNITAASKRSTQHIGDVFIVVQKAYWNQGLGQILLEEGIEWAHSTGILRKLVLNVQVRNERAVHLYKKLGFEIEVAKLVELVQLKENSRCLPYGETDRLERDSIWLKKLF